MCSRSNLLFLLLIPRIYTTHYQKSKRILKRMTEKKKLYVATPNTRLKKKTVSFHCSIHTSILESEWNMFRLIDTTVRLIDICFVWDRHYSSTDRLQWTHTVRLIDICLESEWNMFRGERMKYVSTDRHYFFLFSLLYHWVRTILNHDNDKWFVSYTPKLKLDIFTQKHTQLLESYENVFTISRFQNLNSYIFLRFICFWPFVRFDTLQIQ